MTRIGYALLLLVNSVISWLMLTDWAFKKLEHLTLDYMKISCNGKQCYGFVAVHRMNFALGAFHFILAVLLLGVTSSRDKRAPIQNGFWGPKILAWAALVVITFLIPEGFFITWGNYVALAGAVLFLLLGLILLVDLAHTWAEHCLERIDATESKMWQGMLVGSTLTMYSATLAMTIVMYIFFAGHHCTMNQAAITVCPQPPTSLFHLDPSNNSLDKLPPLHPHNRPLHPPRHPILQSPRRPLPIRHGRRVHHLSNHVRRGYGTRRPAM